MVLTIKDVHENSNSKVGDHNVDTWKSELLMKGGDQTEQKLRVFEITLDDKS
ncbi:hypothetical protein Bca101_063459 [Brassica carinata]